MSRRSSRYASASLSFEEPNNDTEEESSDSILMDLSEESSEHVPDVTQKEEELELEMELSLSDSEIEYDLEEEDEEEFLLHPRTSKKSKTKQKLPKHKRKQTTSSSLPSHQVDEEHSITQGCFLVPPKKRKSKSTTSHHFTALMENTESKRARTLRYEAYQHHWRLLKQQIEDVRETVYNTTFENVREFIQGQHKSVDTKIWECGGQKQLPAAVIIVGMNVLDHQRLLYDLVDHLEDKKTLLITLQSKDCATTTHALFSLVSQCLNHPRGYIDETQIIPSSRNAANIRQLISWYKLLCKQKKVPLGGITIGVLLLDFECFTTDVAQLLVSLCSNHLDVIPFTFIIGLATSVSSIHQMLPRSVCSRLKMEKFRFAPPSQQLKLILQRIFLENPPLVQLGFDSLQVIFNRFEEANISIESFSRSLQFVYMEHFSKNPISFLTLFDSSKVNQELLGVLEDSHFTYIRSLPSVKTALGKLEPAKSKLLRKNDTALLQYISYWSAQLVHSRVLFSVAFQCYASLPYFSNERKEYLHFLFLYAHHNDALQRFHILRQSSLKKRLRQSDIALHVLQTWKDTLSTYPNDFEKVIPAIKHLQNIIRVEQEPGSQLTRDTFKKLRKFIAKFLSQFMKPCSHFPLHEAFCYNQMRPLQEAFTPQIQNVIRQSMLHPDLFLGYIPPHHLPDTCLAFSFYEENGKRINLYDWYVQFSDQCKKQKDEDITQARYLRALTELQLLGFIQPKNSNIVERCV